MRKGLRSYTVPSKYYDRKLPNGKLYTYKGAYINLSYECNLDVCPYCYARGQRISGTISQPAFFELLQWLEVVSDKREIQLVGGEPTVIRDLSAYLDIAYAQGFRITVYTNGSFPLGTAIRLRQHPAVAGVIFHFEPAFFRVVAEYDSILHGNLSKLCGYKDLELIYCISTLCFDYTEVLRLAQEYGMKVRWIFPTPTAGNTPYFGLHKMKEAGPRLQQFLSEALRLGVETQPDLSVPLCIFEDSFLKAHAQALGLVKLCFPFASIDPDLTVNFCTSIPSYRSKRLGNAVELRQAVERFRAIRQSMSGRFPFPECKDCSLYEISCQGGCLTYRLFQTDN